MAVPANYEAVLVGQQDMPAQAAHPGMNRVVFLMALSVLINYIDRSNLSIAAPLLQDELHITSTQLGTLLAAFFWTYGLTRISHEYWRKGQRRSFSDWVRSFDRAFGNSCAWLCPQQAWQR